MILIQTIFALIHVIHITYNLRIQFRGHFIHNTDVILINLSFNEITLLFEQKNLYRKIYTVTHLTVI